jgi:hypothetical protein
MAYSYHCSFNIHIIAYCREAARDLQMALRLNTSDGALIAEIASLKVERYSIVPSKHYAFTFI